MITVELRWFTEHAITHAQLRAFAADPAIERRVDRYLLGTPPDCGIKQRGPAASLERKLRVSSERVHVPLADGPLDGQIERWRKHRARDAPDGEWLAVAKRRARRHQREAYAELTQLSVPPAAGRGPTWTTFAVELRASKREARDVAKLIEASAELLGELPWLAAALRHGRSCGYPAWLGQE